MYVWQAGIHVAMKVPPRLLVVVGVGVTFFFFSFLEGCDLLTISVGERIITITLKRYPVWSLCWHISWWEKVCNHNYW